MTQLQPWEMQMFRMGKNSTSERPLHQQLAGKSKKGGMMQQPKIVLNKSKSKIFQKAHRKLC